MNVYDIRLGDTFSKPYSKMCGYDLDHISGSKSCILCIRCSLNDAEADGMRRFHAHSPVFFFWRFDIPRSMIFL